MTAVIITPSDLAPFANIDPAKAEAMIEDATATAYRVAPCLKDTTDEDMLGAAKAVLRAAILRWNDAGSGQYQQVQNGAFMAGFQQTARKSLFWPSEIDQLQELCRSSDTGDAYSIDTAPTAETWHEETCSLVFGAAYCSCGADLAGFPLYGQP